MTAIRALVGLLALAVLSFCRTAGSAAPGTVAASATAGAATAGPATASPATAGAVVPADKVSAVPAPKAPDVLGIVAKALANGRQASATGLSPSAASTSEVSATTTATGERRRRGRGRDRVAVPETSATLYGPAVKARVTLATAKPGKEISPLLWGVSFANEDHKKEAGITLDRWGGNRFSRFDWRTGNDAAGNDWFFVNGGQAAKSPEQVWIHDSLKANRAAGIETLITVPTIGWVAKDSFSYSFSVTKYGAQKAVESWNADRGNGVRPDGTNVTGNDPTDAGKPVGPEYMGEQVAFLKSMHGPSSTKPRLNFALDNEPGIWNSTHRDVHPEPVSYDELWERTVAYANAIKDADPTALVWGPVEWGWLGILRSAKDGANNGADSKAHNSDFLLKWYIQKLAEHKTRTGRLLVDVIDTHDYPEIYVGDRRITQGSGPAIERARILAVRTWWDRGYKPSGGEQGTTWIWEPMYLLPRIQDMIRQSLPGLKLAITEYGFGGNDTVNGALVHALIFRALMREGVYAACEWGPPRAGDPALLAYKLFRNYDGKGGAFTGRYVEGSTADSELTVFGALDRNKRILRVAAVNTDPAAAREVTLNAGLALAAGVVRTFTLGRDNRNEIVEGSLKAKASRSLVFGVPAYSVVMLECRTTRVP